MDILKVPRESAGSWGCCYKEWQEELLWQNNENRDLIQKHLVSK
jgi:hypothetical protein